MADTATASHSSKGHHHHHHHHHHDPSLLSQTIEVGDPLKGEGRARRASKHPVLTAYYDPDVRTVHDAYEAAAKKFADTPFLGTRAFLEGGKRGAYQWITYGQSHERWVNQANGLKHLGVEKGDRVGIFAINRTEWILTDAACHYHGYVPVALYATLGANAVEYVVNHSELKVVLCDEKNIDKCTGLVNCPQLKTIICYDPVKEEVKQNAKDKTVLTLEEVENLGKAHPSPPTPPVHTDLYTIMYTSGSTGNPKGVLLTHGNMIAELAGTQNAGLDLIKGEVHMSYLPLAHSFERVICTGLVAFGGSIGFFQGSIPELFNDIAELRPTFLAGAPRVWQRLHDKMWSTVNSGSALKRLMFSWGVNSKMHALKAGGSTPIWDTILFEKTKAKLGGRVKWIISGAAPLDPKLADFLRACFCCPVVQGYGLTENTAGACITYKHDTEVGHVGPPFSCTEVKLVDVPEMNYFSTDTPCPRGEICLRGPNVFIGYYKDPEKTAEDLRSDGWFHTGDIGRWNTTGTLSIIDRKKNIFKLSQGEYVAAEYLEGIFVRSPFVGQIFVYGDSLNSFLVAVVVPDFEVLHPWASEHGISHQDNVELCKNKKVEEVVLKSMTEVGKDAKLHGFEYPKAIYVEPTPFSEDNNLLTPTFKLRRPNLKEHYQQTIANIYEEYKKAHPDA